jgi:hypothetical protein
MNQIPKKRRIYRALTSETRATARMSGMTVPKSPSDHASSERLNFRGGREVWDMGIRGLNHERGNLHIQESLSR